ncbi:GH3 auxin-responsive promoter family protein [Chloroflexota bacterium]
MSTKTKQLKEMGAETELLEKGKKVATEPEPIEKGTEMAAYLKLLKAGEYKELWQQCCGFIDLSLEEVMNIQKRLLLEQLELLKKCELGRYVMNGANPYTVEEFRERVPLTTYNDYAGYLLKQRMDVLPRKPIMWAHTSGRSGEYDFKWVPVTGRQWEEVERYVVAVFCFATCTKRGEVNFKLHDRMLYGAAPPPYVTGNVFRYAISELIDFLPPVDEAETMSFPDRFQKGFELALSGGLDFNAALPSVMVASGERFGQGGGKKDIKALLGQPQMLFRIMRGVIKSKLARRPMLPKDVWSLKGAMSFGSDSSVYREKIKEMWGRYPLDLYCTTEAMTVALQTWDYQGLTFYPTLNFFEFIPEEESIKSREDPAYQPSTLLLDGVKPGENYEVVYTNFHGGPFVRYRQGDMIKITAMRNEQLNIDIPQMEYHSRVDDMIDIAGFTRLTETLIWKALENAGIAYEDWAARKELKDKPILRLYLEPRESNQLTVEEVATLVHQQLTILDTPYSELESYVGLKPLEVTFVPQGAFNRYMLKQQAAGVELGRLKVSHINPTDDVVDFLLGRASQVTVSSKTKRQQENVSA